MKMNTKELKKMMDWKATGMVKGVKVRGGVLPEVGNGASHGINGDSYGFIITEVAPDGTWFKYGSGEKRARALKKKNKNNIIPQISYDSGANWMGL